MNEQRRTPQTSPSPNEGEVWAAPPTELDTGEPASSVAQPSRRLEIAAAVFALIVCGALAFLAGQIELRTETAGVDPRWWPRLLGLGGLTLSAILIVVVLLRPVLRDDLEDTTRDGWVRLGTALVLTVLFMVTWPLAGFVFTAPIYLASMTAVFGARRWKALILFPLGLTAFIYGLFHIVLRVPL